MHITRVARTADGERVERVRVHPVQELDRVGALHVDLPERAHVLHGHGLADRAALAEHRLLHRLAAAREVARAVPLADVLHHGAAGEVPRVDRRHAHGIEEGAAVTAGEQRERDRYVRRPERRRAELARMDAEQLGGDSDRVHVRRLALVGAGADRREALHVLDRAQARADRAAYIGDRGVALQVDEAHVLVAVGQREGRRVRKARAGRAADTLDASCFAVRDRRADPVVPAQPAARLAPEVDARAPAAGDRGHAVGHLVLRGGTGEHDPGPVVVGEDERPLERAGREHDPLRADLPEPAAALDREHVVAVVDRHHGRPLEHAHVAERLTAALLGEDHTPRRLGRGRPTRLAGADD